MPLEKFPVSTIRVYEERNSLSVDMEFVRIGGDPET
jgi:hypothetical protein